jgi:Fic family protein
MGIYIHQPKGWPVFRWDQDKLVPLLTAVRHRQGRHIGRMESLGPSLRSGILLQTLVLDTVKSSETEGVLLNPGQVRSSLARRLGIGITGLVHTEPQVERVAEMVTDAVQHYDKDLSADRISGWHTAILTAEPADKHRVSARDWRGHGKRNSPVHYETSDTTVLKSEMAKFLRWFNNEINLDPVIKAAIAQRWFLSIHPFDEGNGRIARLITNMQLSRAGDGACRGYSLSAEICREPGIYHSVLEKTGKAMPDITVWLEWFLTCMDRALVAADETPGGTMGKARFRERHETGSFNSRQRQMIERLLGGSAGKLVSSTWATLTQCSQDTALRDIQDLVDRGILQKDGAGGRSTGYLLKEPA